MELQPPSLFAQMVDKLRDKTEEELKMLYLKFFSSELADEWKMTTTEADFRNATEEDIIKAIQKARYKS